MLVFCLVDIDVFETGIINSFVHVVDKLELVLLKCVGHKALTSNVEADHVDNFILKLNILGNDIFRAQETCLMHV